MKIVCIWMSDRLWIWVWIFVMPKMWMRESMRCDRLEANEWGAWIRWYYYYQVKVVRRCSSIFGNGLDCHLIHICIIYQFITFCSISLCRYTSGTKLSHKFWVVCLFWSTICLKDHFIWLFLKIFKLIYCLCNWVQKGHIMCNLDHLQYTVSVVLREKEQV